MNKYEKKEEVSYIKINANGKVKASMADVSDRESSTFLISEGAYFTPCLNNDGTKILYSSGNDIYELDLVKNNIKQLTTLGNCYNPVYYEKDNNLIAFARNDGIYLMDISKNDIKKVTGSKDSKISFAKPNFTAEGDLIYFKVSVHPREDGHGFVEKNPSINRINKDGKNDIKLIDGYNPLLFKDGKTLIYEMDDNLYLMNFDTNDKKLIDTGKYAAFSDDGKYISYTKYERKTVPYTKIKGKSNLFVDKEYSNIYIAEVNNLKNKYKLTEEEFEDREKEIEEWANATKDYKTEQHFLIVSKVAYFDSLWSKNNENIYMSVYNSDKGAFELIKKELSLK